MSTSFSSAKRSSRSGGGRNNNNNRSNNNNSSNNNNTSNSNASTTANSVPSAPKPAPPKINAWQKPLSTAATTSSSSTIGPAPGLAKPSNSNKPGSSGGSSNNNNNDNSSLPKKTGKVQEPPLALRERFLHFWASLVGNKVFVTLTDGSQFEGVFHTATPFAKSSYKYVFKSTLWKKHVSDNVANGSTVVLDMDQVAHMHVKSMRLVESGRASSSNFTDTEISGKNMNGASDDHRLVQADASWTQPLANGHNSNNNNAKNRSSLTSMALEDSKTSNWDQFSANEQLFNVKGSYDENIYTTKLDKSRMSQDQIKQAEQLAREIENTTSDNIHIAQERGQALEQDWNEEELFSGVVRNPEPKEKSSSDSNNVNWRSQMKSAKPSSSSNNNNNHNSVSASGSSNVNRQTSKNDKRPPVRASSTGKSLSEAFQKPSSSSSDNKPASSSTVSASTPAAAAVVAAPPKMNYAAALQAQRAAENNKADSEKKSQLEAAKGLEIEVTEPEKARTDDSKLTTSVETPKAADHAAASDSAVVTPELSAALPTMTTATEQATAQEPVEAVDETLVNTTAETKEEARAEATESKTDTAAVESTNATKKAGTKLNANAKEFTLNINAKSFTPFVPGGGGGGGVGPVATHESGLHMPSGPPQPQHFQPHMPYGYDNQPGMPMMHPQYMGQPGMMMPMMNQPYPGMRYPYVDNTGGNPPVPPHIINTQASETNSVAGVSEDGGDQDGSIQAPPSQGAPVNNTAPPSDSGSVSAHGSTPQQQPMPPPPPPPMMPYGVPPPQSQGYYGPQHMHNRVYPPGGQPFLPHTGPRQGGYQMYPGPHMQGPPQPMARGGPWNMQPNYYMGQGEEDGQYRGRGMRHMGGRGGRGGRNGRGGRGGGRGRHYQNNMNNNNNSNGSTNYNNNNGGNNHNALPNSNNETSNQENNNPAPEVPTTMTTTSQDSSGQ